MELKLRDGDYVPDGAGGFLRLEGRQALLAQALLRLTARRGQFPFWPELGSRLYRLAVEKPSGRDAAAAQYAQEALANLDVQVLDARVTAADEKIARVAVTLAAGGETGTVEVTV